MGNLYLKKSLRGNVTGKMRHTIVENEVNKRRKITVSVSIVNWLTATISNYWKSNVWEVAQYTLCGLNQKVTHYLSVTVWTMH